MQSEMRLMMDAGQASAEGVKRMPLMGICEVTISQRQAPNCRDGGSISAVSRLMTNNCN